MIKQLHGTDLSSSKTRSGMNSLAELIPRLMRSYELQAELMKQREKVAAGSSVSTEAEATVQGTFQWYE